MGKFYKLSEPFKVPYDMRIRGYGEIYEVQSVEMKRKHLFKTYARNYPNAVLYLEPLNEKSFQLNYPVSYKELADNILSAGGTDRPFWKCNPKENGKSPSMPLMLMAKIACWFLVRLEPYNLWKSNPHISYILLKENKTV